MEGNGDGSNGVVAAAAIDGDKNAMSARHFEQARLDTLNAQATVALEASEWEDLRKGVHKYIINYNYLSLCWPKTVSQ